MENNYNYNDIKEAYEKIGVTKGMTISLKTDLRFLGPYSSNLQNDLLEAHFNILADLVDLSKGTIVVTTACTSLCNTNTIFDIKKTPSEMGSLTEYIRNQSGAIRSFHPFNSYTAIGKHADYICTNNSRHCYGNNTPTARLLELDGTQLSIGLHPIETTSISDHVEMVMGVPYRYVKEFIHPVIREDKVVYEPFYMNLRYLELLDKGEAVKSLSTKVFPNFYKFGHRVQEESLGRGKIYLFSMNEFFSSTIQLFTNDLYACLTSEPSIKPYQK
jgi:aminoglycoside 3-N-acetyltransferase